MVGSSKMKKGKIELEFGRSYSDEEKQGIVFLFSKRFEVNISEYFLFERAFPEPLLITIKLLGILSTANFLRGFAGEAGKLLAQKLFPPKKNIGKIKLEIRYHNEQIQEVSVQIIASNWQELIKKIMDYDYL
jgi:hypothetical protein